MCILSLSACGGNGSPDTGAAVQPHAGNGGLPRASDNGASPSHPTGYFSYEPPIVPIVLTIDTDGNVSLSAGKAFATPIGTFSFGLNAWQDSLKHTALPDQPFDATQLIICQSGANRQHCAVLQINSGRKVNITMNGRFQQTVERNRITIDAAPGSTLTVKDSGGPVRSGPHPAALVDLEELDFSALSTNTEVDLERSLSGTKPDLSYDHMTGDFGPSDGALVHVLGKYASVKGRVQIPPLWSQHNSLPKLDLPGENDCAHTKPAEWRGTFSGSDLKADVVLACIETADGDFGYLVIGHNGNTKPTSYYVYSYVWVR
jgi:hypothetical protein